jgi:UDP-N-acetylglucosamine 2-epimerase
VLGALDTDPQPTLFTAANEDPGGMAMNETIRTFVANRPWTVFRPTLGPRLYASALRHAAVMIGNSSSGIIEAGLFGLSVINIGSRQDRRDRGANVTDVPAEPEPVLRALRSLGPRPARFPAGTPYGDGASGRRVAALLTSPPNLHCLFQKRFHAAT